SGSHFSAFPRSFPSERCRNSYLYATLMFSDQTAPV
ncbi:Putative DNA adenine methyltransferase from phage origin, partial [Escherichia coli O104:H4 str. E112/10]